MKRTAQGNADHAVAIPAGFNNSCFKARMGDRVFQCRSGCAGIDQDVEFPVDHVGLGKREVQIGSQFTARRILVDQRRLRTGYPRSEIGDERPDNAGAEDGHAVARLHACIPDDVERCFHIGGKHRPSRRQRVR